VVDRMRTLRARGNFLRKQAPGKRSSALCREPFSSESDDFTLAAVGSYGWTELYAGGSRQICHIADLTTADVDALSKCTAGVSIQIARQRDHPISICCFVS